MVFTGYDEEQAIVEAMRCIHCPSPEPCILGCPVHNDIPSALLAFWAQPGRRVRASLPRTLAIFVAPAAIVSRCSRRQ